MHLSLLTDYYQLSMMGGYLKSGKLHQDSVFDLFFRKIPDQGGFCVAAGLQAAIDYIRGLSFADSDIDYLRSLRIFDDAFLKYLRDFCFTGDVMGIEEGTLVFPGEPLLRVTAPLPQAQMLETTLLNLVNFETLIATKAARICEAAKGGTVLEFGLRRAQGPDGGLRASRAAFIGGCAATSNVLAGKEFGIPVRGTHAHAWIMSFSSELAAFRAYAEAYPDGCTLLVDTYDTLESGVPTAILVGKEMEARGQRLKGVRLDSGDLAYLSKETRRMLDEAGLNYVQIVASSDLDEWLIHDLRNQGARIDTYGVGTRLVTSYRTPALGGVYKLVAATDDSGRMTPRIKVSSNAEKMTNPGIKQVWRLYNDDNLMLGDVIALQDEHFAPGQRIRTRHPSQYYERKSFTRVARVEPLLTPIFQGGQLVYQSPPLPEIQRRARAALGTLRSEHKRFYNADIYWVGLSERLFDLRERLIEDTLGEHVTR